MNYQTTMLLKHRRRCAGFVNRKEWFKSAEELLRAEVNGLSQLQVAGSIPAAASERRVAQTDRAGVSTTVHDNLSATARPWRSGNVRASHARVPGSSPGGCF